MEKDTDGDGISDHLDKEDDQTGLLDDGKDGVQNEEEDTHGDGELDHLGS